MKDQVIFSSADHPSPTRKRKGLRSERRVKSGSTSDQSLKTQSHSTPNQASASTRQDKQSLDHKLGSNSSDGIRHTTSGKQTRKQLSTMAKLIKDYQEAILKSESAGGPFIHVDEIASKVAILYERIRQVVDWKEEHLIRRGAINRILKRKMIPELSGLSSRQEVGKMAESLVLELIRGAHFSNGEIPQQKVIAVQKALEKYVYLLKKAPFNPTPSGLKKRVNFFDWLLEITACEIEEILDPFRKEKLLIECMTAHMEEKIQIRPSQAMTNKEKQTQTFIAVHRALFNLDAPIITYHLLKRRYPQWSNPSEAFWEKIKNSIFSIKEDLEKDLKHPLAGEFFKFCEKEDTVYLIIGDILDRLSKNATKIPQMMADKKIMKKLTKETYDQRLSTLKSRLFRMAIFSTLSIFIASGFSLFVIEVPLAKLFYGKFNLLAIFVDIMLPTALMFLLVVMVRLPKEDNLRKLIKKVLKVVHQGKEKDIYEIRVDKKKGQLMNFIIGSLYLLGSLLSLGFIYWIFYISRIPITSVYIDTMNVAVVIFAALVIRQRAKELTVEEKGTLGEFLVDVVSVPVAKLGQWLANKWREYNIISVFFSILIDMPFSVLIEFIENWSSFIRNKKAEIR